jgi:glycogen phosphorylase
MEMARFLVSGVDLWLNNPIRPHEASGTSGMKASLNGVPNCSILDGWWAEGYTGANGWAIGEEREYQDQETQNDADVADLYNKLEREIIPTFFDRDAQGLSRRWIAIMKEAIRTVAPEFSMMRQVQDYTARLYIPTIERNAAFVGSQYEKARQLAQWKHHVLGSWGGLSVSAQGPNDTQIGVGHDVEVTAELALGALKPEDVLVELVIGRDQDWKVIETGAVRLDPQGATPRGTYLFRNSIAAENGGSLVYGVRVIPAHPDLATKYELGLVRWA